MSIQPADPRLPLLLTVLFVAAFAAHAEAQPWTSLGPEGGIVSVLAFDPADPNRLLAGSTGGIYVSTDGGDRWSIRFPGLASPSGITGIEPNAVVFDPTDSSVLYAAVFGDRSFSDGVFKSVDGGVTWQGIGFEEQAVRSLALDPSNTSTAYAGTNGGVFKSTDAGATWVEKNQGIELPDAPTFWVSALAVDPATPSTLYAGLEPFGLWKSVNGGDSWASLHAGLPPGLPDGGGAVNAIAVDPVDPSVVYVVANNSGVFKTTDAGTAWRRVLPILTAGVVRSLEVHPVDRTVYAAGDRLFKSTDLGRRWTRLDAEIPAFFQVNALAVHPGDSSVVFIGDSQGRGLMKTVDGGLHWVSQNRGFHATSIRTLARYGPILYAADVLKVHKSTDHGQTWNLVNRGGDLVTSALVIDRRAPETVYAGTVAGVRKTTDGGETWRPVGPELPIRALAMDPTDASVIYAGAQERLPLGGVFKTTDGGQSWIAVNEGLSDLNVGVLAMPTPETLYAGTFGSGGVFRSTDAGATWSARNFGLPTTSGLFVITALAVHPTDPLTVYAGTLRDGVFKTVNGGDFWFPAGFGITDSGIGALAMEPSNSSILYVGTNFHGVFRSTDAAFSWVPFNTGLTHQGISALDVYAGGTVFAATHGGGVFGLELCPSTFSLCLNGNRFRVDVRWKDFADNTGRGRVVPVGSESSGLFFFFTSDNWEMLVKVLDGCSINDHFWVFAAATTNVEYTLSVTDTATGEVREYHNPLGRAAPATTDSTAFATCPDS